MFFEDILQFKILMWGAKLKANCILEKNQSRK